MTGADGLSSGLPQHLQQSGLALPGSLPVIPTPPSNMSNMGMSSFVPAAQHQPLFTGASTANFDLPFMLSMDTDAADDPEAAAAFSEMLNDLLAEPLQPTDQQQDQQAQQVQQPQQLQQQMQAHMPLAATGTVQQQQPQQQQQQQQQQHVHTMTMMQTEHLAGLQSQQPALSLGQQPALGLNPVTDVPMANSSVPMSGLHSTYQQQQTLPAAFPAGMGLHIAAGSGQGLPQPNGHLPVGLTAGPGFAPGLLLPTASGISSAGHSLHTGAQRINSQSGAEVEVNSSGLDGVQPMPPGFMPQTGLGLRRSYTTRSSSGSENGRVKAAGVHVDAAARRAAVQKRYRQKKDSMMRILNAEASKQQETLATLQEEHAALLGKQQALEKLVMCRDEQLLILSKVRGMCRGIPSMPTGMPGGPSKHSLDLKADYKLAGCWGPDCAAPLHVNEAQLLQFKQMTVEDLRRVWTSFVAQASQRLSSEAMSGVKPDVEAGKELEELVYEHGLTFRYSIQLNCPVVYMMMQLNLDTGMPAVPADSHWQHVINLIQLTPSQRSEAVSMFNLYCALMEKVHEERRMLKTRLADLVTASTAAAALADISPASMLPDSMQHLANTPAYLMPPGPCCADEMSCAEQLYLNLHKERSTRCLLCCFFLGKLLSSTQLARAAVASHPWFPDPLSLSKQLAAEAGQLPRASSSG